MVTGAPFMYNGRVVTPERDGYLVEDVGGGNFERVNSLEDV